MRDGSIPDERVELVPGLVFVAARLPDLLYEPSADQDSPGVLVEGHALRIEESQRAPWLHCTEEPVEECVMVVLMLDPLGLEIHQLVGAILELRAVRKVIRGGERLCVLTQHPSERDAE